MHPFERICSHLSLSAYPRELPLTTAKLTQKLVYAIVCAFTILAMRFGLGTPDDELTAATQIRAVTYAEWGEMCYLVTIMLAKTSIGIAVLRLARRQAIRWVVIIMIVMSNILYMTAMVVGLVGCQLLGEYKLMAGCTKVPVLRKKQALPKYPAQYLRIQFVKMIYSLVCLSALLVMSTSTLTDAAYAIIPAILLRGLQMPARPKYALIGVFAIGGLATVACVARFALAKHWALLGPGYGSLCEYTESRPYLQDDETGRLTMSQIWQSGSRY